jgi:nucleolar protein 56
MQKDIEQLRRQLIRKARKQVEQRYSEKDVHVIRAVSLLNDLDSAFNLLAENCIEWYSAHFPEMHAIVRDNEVYLKIVREMGERQSVSAKKLEKLLGESDKAGDLEEKARKSMGSALPKNALQEIRMLAENSLKLKEERKNLQQFIEAEMERLAPNFSRVAGPILGARLVAAASGLKQLALMPSSTVQLLGAEKALFRHLRNRQSKGPKYGLIYGHPLVRAVLGKHKGKLARSLASKMVLAARVDYFGNKKDISGEMLAELEARAKQLQ